MPRHIRASTNARRLGWIASFALGRVALRRRVFVAVIRRSKRAAKWVVMARIARRAFGRPSPSVVSIKAQRAVIDVEAS